MSEFSESRWDTLFINADCIVKKGEQRENINEKKIFDQSSISGTSTPYPSPRQAAFKPRTQLK